MRRIDFHQTFDDANLLKIDVLLVLKIENFSSQKI